MNFCRVFAVAFCCLPVMATNGVGITSLLRSSNHVLDERKRQLQDNNENPITFQLKMYWQEGYFWQEESFERKWCLQCNDCTEGEELEIHTCDDDKRQRFIYEEVPGSGGGRIKPNTRRDLCWTGIGERKRHELQPCDLNCRQIIEGLSYEEFRFEMHPNGRPLECLEQHHHPKAGEVVYANDCEAARGDTTSYWVMINKRGGNYSTPEDDSDLLVGSTTITNMGDDACRSAHQCGLCLGNCKANRHCRDGLECLIRDGNETVPGCDGAELAVNDGVNVCFDPTGNYTLPTTPAPTLPGAPTPTSPPVELYGDCEQTWAFTIPPTTTPTPAPSTTPTTSTAPSNAPTFQGYCEPDNTGLFGMESSNSVVVDYAYELVMDPSQNADTNEVVQLLARNILQSVLPTLFSDICTETPSQRRLQGNVTNGPSGIRIGGSDSPSSEVNCTGVLSGSDGCIVINATMLVFTDGNETYNDLLLPVVKEYIDSGRLKDAHPAVINAAYVTEAQNRAAPSTSETAEDKLSPVWFGVLGAVVGFGLMVIVVFVIWKRRKGRRSIDDVSDAEVWDASLREEPSIPPLPQKKELPPPPYMYPYGMWSSTPPEKQSKGEPPASMFARNTYEV